MDRSVRDENISILLPAYKSLLIYGSRQPRQSTIWTVAFAFETGMRPTSRHEIFLVVLDQFINKRRDRCDAQAESSLTY